jgi:dienelactone hydrolase
MKVWSAVAIAAVLALGASSAGSAHPDRVRVEVTPASTWIDAPVHVRVTGLRSNQVATLSLRGRDARGRLWGSSARFRAGSQGTIDVDRAKSLSGSYTGVWGTGLLATLARKAPLEGTLFYWNEVTPNALRLAVKVGKRVSARATFRRGLPGSAVHERSLSLAGEGIFGQYYAPAQPSAASPAVLVFGGSEGGLRTGRIAELLAARGYPALAIAYFDEPGLPRTLSAVPLEYFEHALRWLGGQPGVDPARISVFGISRGGEAAQLLGVHYPVLVHAVVATVTSNAAACSYPGCDGPAWTLEGHAVPYTNGLPVPEQDGEGVIHDELIRGPVFLACGGRDEVTLSCPYARAIVQRLQRFHHPYVDELHAYPEAGHFVGALLPGVPVAPHWLYFSAATERAREDVWPKLLRFLSRVGARGRGGTAA